MALTFYPNADQPVTLPLGHDPDVLEANGEDAVVRYVLGGDASALDVPETASRIIIRPLTTDEMRAAGTKAGVASALGAVLVDRMSEVVEKAKEKVPPLTVEEQEAANLWMEKGEGPGNEVLEEYGKKAGAAAQEASARFLEGLTDAEQKAIQDYRQWEHRRDTEILRAGWLGVSDWEVPRERLLHVLNHNVFPLSFREQVREEILSHVRRISVLPPEGKD